METAKLYTALYAAVGCLLYAQQVAVYTVTGRVGA